jgi:hypothetical protein
MTISSLPTLIVLALSAPLVAAACSSGGLGSYDADLKLEELSDGDATQYCKTLKEHTESKVSTKNASCAALATVGAASAQTDAELRTACQKIYDSCIASPDQPSFTDACETFHEAAKTCEGLTVAEFNACTDESIDRLKTLADPKFCSSLKLESSTMAPPSPRCDVVKARCPALLPTKP